MTYLDSVARGLGYFALVCISCGLFAAAGSYARVGWQKLAARRRASR